MPPQFNLSTTKADRFQPRRKGPRVVSFMCLMGGSCDTAGAYACPRRAAANAVGSATLTISSCSRSGKPMRYAHPGGLSWMLTIPRPEPFTSQRPPNPCTPRLNGRTSSSDTDATADRGNRDRNAHPIRTCTCSLSKSRYELEGGNPTTQERTRYHRSKLIGNRAIGAPPPAVMFARRRSSCSPPNVANEPRARIDMMAQTVWRVGSI